MTATIERPRSAYPQPVDDLLPQARDLATKLGVIPSRNRLMAQFRIGARKANALRETLTAESQLDTDAAHLRPVPDPPETDPAPDLEAPETAEPENGGEESEPQPAAVADPGPSPAPAETQVPSRRVRSWPVILLAAPAFVAVWSGWVGLGGLTGFGVVHPLPGIWDSLSLDTAITLPIGVETYAAYALRAWLSPAASPRARRFARASTIGALLLGALGQIAYHLMTAAGITHAPWPVTTIVSCLPVAVLGMGAALAHLLHETPAPDQHT